MKVVVFGGAGFLGSHVCDKLTLAGHDVVVFDRVPSLWLSDGQDMIVGDLLDADKVCEAVRGADAVYNFAALADLNRALDQPLETARINILGNIHVLEACRISKVRRFIYASTVYVYSREGGFYRCSKQAAEHYVEEYQKVFGLDYTILRYGSLYGPRADASNGLFRIVRNALETGVVR
ncbi:MAG TPA: NAD(P)-dependent oxidoreductase, partial [Burkholderiales bacterium]|nr:NAD(P)-dependent oxidoreductase [Burkholderiales bacterium]